MTLNNKKMKKELKQEKLELILYELKRIKAEHPKAEVVYDTEDDRIIIYYPIPKDLKFKKYENKS